MSMSSLKMVEERLPPGFRFQPKDEELVCDYLMKKVTRCEHPPFLMEVDLNKSEPWDIPASVGANEWYFYSRRDRKYAIGLRTNRATISGYWKATGKDRPVSRKGSLVGMRKTLVFYQGRAPRGKKSDWVMHEFRLEGPLGAPKLSSSKEDWVLCRVFCKSKEVTVAKQGIGVDGCCYEDTTTSSTNYYDRPPLMDIAPPPPLPPYITFGQTHNEQVHCFSNIFTQNQTNCPTLFSIFNSNSHHIMTRTTKNMEQQPNISSKLTTLLPTTYLNNFNNNNNNNNNNTNNYNNINTNNNNNNNNNSPPPLNMMMMEDSPTSFGEGSNSEISFLSEVGGFPTIWQNHY